MSFTKNTELSTTDSEQDNTPSMQAREIYRNNFTEYLLCLALDVGEGMLKSGAEISRVEDTIERICKAYGALHVEVFSIISMINAAIRMPDGSYSSQMRRIRTSSTDLGRLETYNALSREICSTRPELDYIDKRIKEIKKRNVYKNPLVFLASAFAAGGFALFFGGSLNDGAVAFLIGALIAIVDIKSPSRLNVMAKTVISSFMAAAVAILSAFINISDSPDYVIIGAIMLLVPGVAFGTAMRDLLYGDLLAGTLKTVQAVLSALMIAVGYMAAYVLLGALGVKCPPTPPLSPSESFFSAQFFIACFGSLIGSVGFAIIFKVAPKHLSWCGICGLITYIIYYLVEFFTDGLAFPAAFLSTMFTALFAEIASRALRAPTVVFLIPGVIPTVPGGSLYHTMRLMLVSEWSAAFEYLLGAVQIGFGIAGGILAVSVIFGTIMDAIKRSAAKKKG